MTSIGGQVAAEVRAEMARQRRSVSDLAKALGTTYKPAKSRWSGRIDFSINELHQVATWLNSPIEALVTPAYAQAAREPSDRLATGGGCVS